MKRQKSKYFQMGLTLFLAIAAGIVFYALLFDPAKVKGIFKTVASAMSPVLWGIFIAYILWYIIKWVHKYLDKWIKIKNPRRKLMVTRSIAIFIGLVVMIGVLSALISFIVPSLIDAIVQFLGNLTDYEKTAERYLGIILTRVPALQQVLGETTEVVFTKIGEWVGGALSSNITTMVTNVTSGVVSFGKGVLNFIIGIIVAVYILASKEKFTYQASKLLWAMFKPKTVTTIRFRIHRARRLFDNFIVGKMLDSAIIGVICFVGLTLLKIPYAILISVTVCVTNMIPIVGPFIGAIPSCVLLLLIDPIKALIFAIFILALQQVDGNIIGPKILGNNVGVNAVWIIVALLIGGATFGIIGMFFAVPILAFILEMISDYTNARLKEKKIDGRGNPLDPKEGPGRTSYDDCDEEESIGEEADAEWFVPEGRGGEKAAADAEADDKAEDAGNAEEEDAENAAGDAAANAAGNDTVNGEEDI